MPSAREIRSQFLSFFAQKGHAVCPSAPLVPNDPTLMFTNAGMVPFKDVFVGKETRPYTRATSSQKCIRISGKHNDLENVGRTARHQTFFEMLGNFSFGDYFKEEAIAYAWELLSDVLELQRDRMVFTYFRGEGDIPADEEARALWKRVTGYGDDRVVGMGKDDNFWSMGDTGPCGPCSEIHYWQGPLVDGRVPYERFGEEPDADGHGWFEIWNLVFMQFDRAEGGAMTPLPKPSIDTGVGLERLTSVLMGATSNYDTDLLRPFVEEAARLARKPFASASREDADSMRVIADHARLTAFLIAEGVFPDRGKREYVLRRVMRRAIRHGHRLGIERPFLHEVALAVVREMGPDYPELVERKELIARVTEDEETRFRETLARGLGILDEELARPDAQAARRLGGEAAFRLYDTYGFPLDLTEVIAEERGFSIDKDGYERELAAAKARSEGSQLNKDEGVKAAYHAASQRLGRPVEFTGYEHEDGESRVAALVVGGELVDVVEWRGGDEPLPDVDVVVEKTPFYGRGGGQVGDTGTIEEASGRGRVLVRDTEKPLPGLVVHRARLAQGRLAVGDVVRLAVDHEARSATRRNHSATHLLHWALGVVLGEHVEQKGSLVGPDVLRFDFSHQKPMTEGEIERVEELVNQKILENAPVVTEVLPIKDARARGAKAIFEEKYGDVVRVLTMTQDSVELCGGTHARALGDIGMFALVSEGGVAAGVRRIEAVTGWNAVHLLRERTALLRKIARLTKATSPMPRLEAIAQLQDRVRELEKERAELLRKLAQGGGGGATLDDLLSSAQEIGGVKVLSVLSEIADPAALRELAERLRDKLEGVVVVLARVGDKVQIVAGVAKPLTGRIKAGELVRPIAELVGGSGGGRPDMAMAGGPDVEKLEEARAAVYARAAALLSV